jgi:hypothetical protein
MGHTLVNAHKQVSNLARLFALTIVGRLAAARAGRRGSGTGLSIQYHL